MKISIICSFFLITLWSLLRSVCPPRLPLPCVVCLCALSELRNIYFCCAVVISILKEGSSCTFPNQDLTRLKFGFSGVLLYVITFRLILYKKNRQWLLQASQKSLKYEISSQKSRGQGLGRADSRMIKNQCVRCWMFQASKMWKYWLIKWENKIALKGK